jgi:tetratricopeptide (TPR) repeat protein
MKTTRFLSVLILVFFTTLLTAQKRSGKAPVAGNPELQSGIEEISKVKADIAVLLKKMSVFELKPGANDYSWVQTKSTLVLEDRIEFRCVNRENISVYFSDIIDYQITINFNDVNKLDKVCFGNLMFYIYGKGRGRKFFDDLIFIQNQLIENRNSELPLFEPTAAQYRALKVKPAVSEEQRKFIVQANGFNELKEYDRAIQLYKKAIEVDQTAYPAAYSNLALLSAQLYRFNAAIYYMKKYLMLEPEATDARSAQDKIYKWESMIK